jgi:raffinose/stachyose/melibiose transport system substrate-binding protein
MKKTLSIAAVLMTLVFVLSACTTATTTTTTTAETVPAATTAAAGPVTITLINIGNRNTKPLGGYDAGFFEAIDRFKKDYPNVTVNEEYYPDQTAHQTKIYALAASNDLPNVFKLKGSWVTEFVKNGWAMDITTQVNGDAALKAKFLPGVFDGFTRDGKIYGVPGESMTTSVVFWNKELWAKAGISEFPKTYDELIADAAKFKAINTPMFVMGNKPNWPAESCWFSTFADRITSSDWTFSIINHDGKAKFTDDVFVKALDKFKILCMTPGAFNPDINSIDPDQQNEMYFQGKAGAVVNGTWMMASFVDYPDLAKNTEIAVLPAIDNGMKTASGGPAWSTALSNNATSKDEKVLNAAIILLTKYISGEQTYKTMAELGAISSMKTDFDTSKLGLVAQKYNKYFANISIVPIYDARFESGVIEAMNVGLQELIIGQKDAKTLANEIQKEQDLAFPQ